MYMRQLNTNEQLLQHGVQVTKSLVTLSFYCILEAKILNIFSYLYWIYKQLADCRGIPKASV